MTITKLIEMAFEARKKAYAPYSNFMLGSALVCKTGNVYVGCNVENSSYPLSCCSERATMTKAVTEGEKEFDMIVCVGGPKDEIGETSQYIYPCGACRQIMAEFAKPNMKIICAKSTTDYIEMTLGELLPKSF